MKRLITAAFATLTLLGASWMGAPAASAQDYSACNGVWVVIDYGSLGGGVTTRCATSYSSGTAALRAVSSVTVSNGMILKINSKPSKSDIYQAYWSYWHASRQSDGSYGSWSYSQLGGNSYHPAKGSAEGWHYISLSDRASGPGAKPPKNPVKSAPKPKAPAPNTKAAPAAPAPGAPAAPASAPGQPPASAPAGAPSSNADNAVPDGVPASMNDASDAQPPAPAPKGTPVALIATGSAVAVAGAGAGVWWWKKGRKL